MTQDALKALLNCMTLEEKAGQLAQVPISTCIGGISQATGPMEAYSLTPDMLQYCGSLICDSPGDAESSASAIRSVMQAQPHHIPPVVMKDIIHGCQTVFPIPLAIGSSFDEKHAEQMGRCGAIEGAARGMHVTFAPMVDVVRDPRWGRVMESPGEAPALCAAMGAAMVRGTHGEGIDKKDGLIRPDKRLIAWKKCRLKPGESKTVSFSITPDQLRMYDAAGRAVEPEGIGDLAIGDSSDAPFNAQIIF